MRNNIFSITLCVFFIVLDTLILGYSIGRIYPPIPQQVSAQQTVSSARKEKQEQKSEEQEEISKDVEESQEQQYSEQKSDITEQITQREQQRTTLLTQEEALQIVSLDYLSNGQHIIVTGEDEKSYIIDCFGERYYDEDIGELHYNMPGAKYVVDKYSGEIISVTMQENNTNDAVVQQEDNTIQQTTPHIYTREEVNAMFTMDWVDGCSLYMESELEGDIQDTIINGETCYIGNVVWGNGNRTRMFYVGNQSLKVYAIDETYVGMVTDDFAYELEEH